MSSYLPPTNDLSSFNSQIFQSNLTANELDSKVKSLETTRRTKTIDSGVDTNGTHTGTVSFGVTFASAPVVNGQMISGSNNDAFIINIHTVSTTGFSYSKWYGKESNDTINSASGEDFHWIAIGEVA